MIKAKHLCDICEFYKEFCTKPDAKVIAFYFINENIGPDQVIECDKFKEKKPNYNK